MMIRRLRFVLLILGLLTWDYGPGAFGADQIAAQTATPAPSPQGIEELARIPLRGVLPAGSIDVVLRRTPFTQSDFVTFDTYAGPHLVYAEHGVIGVTMYEPDQFILCRPHQYVLIPTGHDYSVLTMEDGPAASLTFALFGEAFSAVDSSETKEIRCSGIPDALGYRALTAPTPEMIQQMAVTPTVPPFGPEPEELDWQTVDSQGLPAAELVVVKIAPELWLTGAANTGSALPPCDERPGASASTPLAVGASASLCLNGVVALLASSRSGDGLDRLLAFGVIAPGQPLLLVS
jgi:hypothetical protein